MLTEKACMPYFGPCFKILSSLSMKSIFFFLSLLFLTEIFCQNLDPKNLGFDPNIEKHNLEYWKKVVNNPEAPPPPSEISSWELSKQVKTFNEYEGKLIL